MLDKKQVMELLLGNSDLNRARQIFSSYSAKIEHSQLQRTPATPLEVKQMEFEAVIKIKELFDDSDYVY